MVCTSRWLKPSIVRTSAFLNSSSSLCQLSSGALAVGLLMAPIATNAGKAGPGAYHAISNAGQSAEGHVPSSLCRAPLWSI